MADDREHLARLPAELVLLIAEQPSLSTSDLAVFARTSSRYSDLVISVLYRKNIREENASALLWAVLKENTQTMALLIRYGADINSVEASTHLYQSPPYRWIKRLRRWNSHAEDDGPSQTGRRLSSRHGQSGHIANLGPTATASFALPPAGAPQNLALLVPQLPAAQPGALAPQPGPAIPAGRTWRKPDRTREFRFAPLALAARIGLTTAAEWLLENGADPGVPARDLCRCDNEPIKSMNMWRVPHQATPPLMDQPHWTALHLAIHHGHDDIVELLIDHGANARQVCRPEDGPCSALHTAFLHERKSTVESLMYRFEGTDMVDINARGRCGITPLHIAYCLQAANGSLVALALKFGAYVNIEYEIDRNQWTIFSMACVEEEFKFALRLLRIGANAEFDLEQHFGGRWTMNDFRRHIAPSSDDYLWNKGDAVVLSQELDQLIRDHEVAEL